MTEIDDNDVNCYFDTILVCLQVVFFASDAHLASVRFTLDAN